MSYENPRIQLQDSMIDVIKKMAGGNIGALRVLMEIIEKSPIIDPQGAMGGLGAILSLDTENIYEERIWMLYKDVCGENITKMLACLRASQLGIINSRQLNVTIDDFGSLDVDDILSKVKDRLEHFDKMEEKNG